MTNAVSYIYIRSNEYWDNYGAVKLGKTDDILKRETPYITGEINRGKFIVVLEMNSQIVSQIEIMLQEHFKFKCMHIYFDGGTEFYKKEIIECILPYLDKNHIEYRLLSSEEIANLTRNNTENNEPALDLMPLYIRRDYQRTLVSKSNIHFQTNDKGVLIIPCGGGKTLVSLWIAQDLNCQSILIGVPNILLLSQWNSVVSHLFPNIPVLLVCGNIGRKQINDFLETHSKKCIVITTYSSAYKVRNATEHINYAFDMKILDEVHHLTTSNINQDTKTYIHMLHIASNKQLALTATLKLLQNDKSPDDVISNDSIDYFGQVIDKLCLVWAIQQKIICDYVIQTIVANEDQFKQHCELFNITDENDKRLFMSAFISLKSICERHSHHLLIYSNNKDNSNKIIKFIHKLLDANYFNIPNLYYSSYNSEMNSKEQCTIETSFKNAEFGIISCVYCLGEGWDCPLLDGVVFAENMSSIIRIVQSALRASRKNKLEPNKITKILLPILYRDGDDWLDDDNNTDLKKVKEVIYQMGIEDQTIAQKIRATHLVIHDEKPEIVKIKKVSKSDDMQDFGEFDEEITNRLRIKTTKRFALGTSYKGAKKIIANKNITCKEDYYTLCKKDIRLPIDPQNTYKDEFTNWVDYLNISRVYYDLETCKNKANRCLESNPNLKKHYLNVFEITRQLCKQDPMFPPSALWCEYYDVPQLSDIITIKQKSGKKRKSTSL